MTASSSTQPVTPSPDYALTVAVYETKSIELTLTSQYSPEPSLTATATPTQIPPTRIPSPTKTPNYVNCNWAEFVKDITIPDGTEISGGTAFTKVWRLRNVGDCTWTTDYNILFTGGESFNVPVRIGMPNDVDPGETVDISLLLKAPIYPGNYKGYFMLSDDRGNRFGTGTDANEQIWVDIIVRSPNEIISNLSEIYCRAQWKSSVKASLPCPGDELSGEKGFIVYKDYPLREDGAVENEPGLLASPDDSDFGFIYGIFPAYYVQTGDVFRSVIGCTYDSEGCDLIFELRYQIEGGAMRTIKTWREFYDGKYQSVIADLSDLAGFYVNLILYVENNGSIENNVGLWISPRIMR